MAKKKGNSAFMKELTCSEELREVVKSKTISRPDMTKKIWAYIKKNKLQDPEHKRVIVPDALLSKVLGKKPIDMFKMTAALSKHLS